MKDIVNNDYNIVLISFTRLFPIIQKDFIDRLYDLNMLQKGLKLGNQDVKKLFIHCFTYNVCDRLIRHTHKNYKKVLMIQDIDLTKCELSEYCNVNQLDKLIKSTTKLLRSKLPITIIECGDCKVFYENNGEAMEQFSLIVNEYNKTLKRLSDFAKLKKFTKDYGLTFLNKQYFEDLTVKLGLFAKKL